MRATPITSALKRKYSPFKKEESKAQKESKQMLADQTGVYVQTKIKTPGTEGTPATPKKTLRQAYDDALALGYRTEDESFEDYAKRAKADPQYGTSGSEGTEGTEGSEQTSEVKLKTKVEGTGKRSWQSREDLRGGTQAASKSKRAATAEARAKDKLAKMDYNVDNPLKPGDKGYKKQQRLLGKVKKQQSRQRQADAEVENFARMSEEGKTRGQGYFKTERDKKQGEFTDEEQSTMGTRTSGPGAPKKFFGGSGANLSSDLDVDTSLSGTVKEALKFSPNKFKSYGKTSPMKKLTNSSPAKYGNKKSPYKMKGYGNKTY
jgi:hypothetical protein